MAKFVFLSLLFIPTELVLGDILQDENFHPEANVLLSPDEAQGFLFTIQNWQFSEKVLGCWAVRFYRRTLDSEVDGDHTHGTPTSSATHSKTQYWKLSYLSTTNSKTFAVEFALEWVFPLPWKNGVKEAKVCVGCVGRQCKPIPILYQTMPEERW